MRFLLVLCLVLAPLSARAQGLTVFAAASLTDAMTDISVLWVKQNHPALRMSFASSSTLAQQIEQGRRQTYLPRLMKNGWTIWRRGI